MWDKTLIRHLEAVQINEIDGNTEWLARSHFNVGVAYGHLGNFPEAVKQYQAAREIFKSEKMVPEVGRCDESLAEAYAELKDGEKVLDAGYRALDIFNTSKNNLRLSWTYLHLGKGWVLKDEFEKAEEYFEKALDRSRWLDDTNWQLVVNIETEMVNVYRQTNRFELANAVETRIATIQEILG